MKIYSDALGMTLKSHIVSVDTEGGTVGLRIVVESVEPLPMGFVCHVYSKDLRALVRMMARPRVLRRLGSMVCGRSGPRDERGL